MYSLWLKNLAKLAQISTRKLHIWMVLSSVQIFKIYTLSSLSRSTLSLTVHIVFMLVLHCNVHRSTCKVEITTSTDKCPTAGHWSHWKLLKQICSSDCCFVCNEVSSFIFIFLFVCITCAILRDSFFSSDLLPVWWCITILYFSVIGGYNLKYIFVWNVNK